MKNRFLIAVLCLAFLLTLLPCTRLPADAALDNTCGDHLIWSYNDPTETLTITGYGDMTNYSDTKPIPRWYGYRNSMLTVKLPDGLTSIGNYAFYAMEALKYITIPNGVTYIGELAFGFCYALESITIPASVTSIGDGAFACCSAMTCITVDENNPAYCDVDGVLYNKDKTELIYCPGAYSSSYTIPDGVTSIAPWAFSGCEHLTGVTIPASVQSIGAYAFRNCESLTHVTIPDGVPSIGTYAFAYCDGLTGMTIPDSVRSIANYAFYHCSKLQNIVIPAGVPSIEDHTFAGCTHLTGVTIPDSVTSIGECAFDGCTYLESVVIPNHVTSIGRLAFDGCYTLQTVTIPASVTTISERAFLGCQHLYHVHFLGNAPTFGSSVFYNCSKSPALTLTHFPEATGWDTYTEFPTAEWSYTQTEEDGSVTYTCNTCGASYTVAEEEPEIESAAMHLNEEINLRYAVTVPDGYTDPYMAFSSGSRQVTVTDYEIDGDGQYCFEFEDINPQCMGDNITATLHATCGGTEYTDTVAEYSVRDYCSNLLTKTDDAKLIALLSDLLTYGAAAQAYAGYDTDHLVTEGLTLSPSTYTAQSGKNVSFTGLQDQNTFWTAAALVLSNDLAMRFCFVTDSTDGLTVEVGINGRTQTFDVFENAGNDRYSITFDGIKATEFDDTVTARFFRNGVQIGTAVNYSVNTYICGTQACGNANLEALVQALYNYGASAKAYANE